MERGEIVGAAHSYIGEEAVAVGACLALRDDDWITGPPLLYCPQGDVTRAEMAIFLIRALEETPVASPTGIFSDVTAGHFAEGHIERVFELGITTVISGSRIQVGLSL